MCAGYLFQPDKQYDVTYDTGDKAIQCGRHVDIFKFWLMWKAKVSRVDRRVHTCWLKKTEKHLQANKNLHGFVSATLFSAILSVLNCNYWLLFSLQGTTGFEQHIDKCLDLSQYLYNKIKNREGYEMVFDGVVSFPLFIFPLPMSSFNHQG